MVQSHDDYLLINWTCPFNLFSAFLLQPKFYMFQILKGNYKENTSCFHVKEL